jgi:hypothetical protein
MFLIKSAFRTNSIPFFPWWHLALEHGLLENPSSASMIFLTPSVVRNLPASHV